MNSECVDLIYLDPPFNSNQDYAAPVGSNVKSYYPVVQANWWCGQYAKDG